MLQYPKYYMISSGSATAEDQLVSFDAALINAGISNYNLLRVSSILPIGCCQKDHVDLREGSALLVAYGTASSAAKGATIASAIGIGIPCDEAQVGVIMEYAAQTDAKSAEKEVKKMVDQAMKKHGIPYKEIRVSATEATVTEGYTTVISSVTMW